MRRGTFHLCALTLGAMLIVACSDDAAPGPTNCKGNDDCPLKARPVCDTTTGQCVAVTEAGVPDAGPKEGGIDGQKDITPPDTVPNDMSIANGKPCTTGGAPCEVGNHCVDSFCCTTDKCDPCKSCGVAGIEGSCQNDTTKNGTNPGGDACGTGKCAGTCDNGACANFPTVSCSTVCNTTAIDHVLEEKFCDKGACPALPQKTQCLFTKCVGTCAPGKCVKHTDCVTGSVCDRTNAHADGHGKCVDPNNVTPITTATALKNFISTATAAKWGLVSGSLTAISEAIAGVKTVQLAGTESGAAELNATTTSPIFTVSGTAKLVVQGISLVGSTAASAGNAITCFVTATGPSVVVVESSISGARLFGIEAAKCDVTIRRSTISGNDEGGLSLSNGSFTITNALIRNNGTGGVSKIGGAKLDGTVIFEHNTVANNQSDSLFAAGVICVGAHPLKASIIASNSGAAAQVTTCDVSASTLTNTAGTCGLSGFKPSTAGPCFDKATTALKWDRDNKARPTAATADLGCYEVK